MAKDKETNLTPRDETAQFRCSKDVKSLVEKLAARENRTYGNYLENLILREAEANGIKP